MKTKFKLLTLPAALFACGLGMSSGAQAEAYAVSTNNIKDGEIKVFVDGSQVIGANSFITFGTPNSLSSSSATLNGIGVSHSDPGPAPDADASNGTGSASVRTNEMTFVSVGGNTYYSLFGQTATNYSGGDANVVSEQTGTGTPIISRNMAESNVASGFADADGRNVSSTSLTLPITVGSDCATSNCTVSFSFLADPHITAFLDALAEPGSVARGVISLGVSIREVGALADIFTWAPNGTTGGGVLGGTDSSIGDSLNLTVAQLMPGTTTHSGPYGSDIFGSYSAITADNLLKPGNYVLSLSTIEKTDVTRNIPEPATLALLGLGMLGLGFTRRRKHA